MQFNYIEFWIHIQLHGIYRLFHEQWNLTIYCAIIFHFINFWTLAQGNTPIQTVSLYICPLTLSPQLVIHLSSFQIFSKIFRLSISFPLYQEIVKQKQCLLLGDQFYFWIVLTPKYNQCKSYQWHAMLREQSIIIRALAVLSLSTT